ncbi:MAG: response regulator [Desulfobacteraceae bacterium]|nr:response regulator [Desulfobacteraceae bacterium]
MKTTVLIVDDEVPFASALEKRLARRNLDVHTASNGTEALDILQSTDGEIDVVILDVKMPGMDGMETLRRIKTLYPSVEIVLLSGHATMESAIRGMRLGAFDYLTKPCSIEQVCAKVEEAKEKRRGSVAK